MPKRKSIKRSNDCFLSFRSKKKSRKSLALWQPLEFPEKYISMFFYFK